MGPLKSHKEKIEAMRSSKQSDFEMDFEGQKSDTKFAELFEGRSWGTPWLKPLCNKARKPNTMKINENQ